MRRWRDDTAGIPMEAVTRVRDMRTRVEEFDWARYTTGAAKKLATILEMER
jgi:hypothetical protein